MWTGPFAFYFYVIMLDTFLALIGMAGDKYDSVNFEQIQLKMALKKIFFILEQFFSPKMC
jgi:hypothetical protein